MKLFYTGEAIASLQECLNLFPAEISPEKINEIRNRILTKADKLLANPNISQVEVYFEHLGKSHRRVIEGNYKIIYRLEGEVIYITDIFDTS